jgi:predicted RNA-binding protein YlqC (UPF0109 family)
MIDPILALIYDVITNMVDSPKYVRVDRIESEDSITYYVFTKEGELGQVIGKKGDLGNCIRKIIKSAAKKHQILKRVYLDVRQ